jgi:hypothetical protein
MTPLVISSKLVGTKVSVPSRPEWGVGTVLSISSTVVNGEPLHRVSIQFHLGARTLVVPPAVLSEPRVEPERKAGWLDALAGRTLDDALVRLPDEIENFLGPPERKIVLLARLYESDSDDPKSLAKWAKRQTNVGDPLSHWSRDELLVAWGKFATERDTALRVAAAKLKQLFGPGELEAILARLDRAVAERVRGALRRVI